MRNVTLAPAQRIAWVIAASCVALASMIYLSSASSGPSADDFIFPEVARRLRAGSVWSVFMRSPMNDYRPLEWITATWWIGDAVDPFRRLHLLTLTSVLPCLAVLWMWLRHLNISGPSAAVAVALFVAHPVLTGPLAELDGFMRFYSAFPMWLGVFAADRLATKPTFAVPLAMLLFAWALGYTEYSVAMLLMCPLAIWHRTDEARWTRATAMAVGLTLIVAGFLALRAPAIAGAGSPPGLSLSPVLWGKHLAMIGVALTYPGNTVDVVLNRSPAIVAMLIFGCVAVMSWILMGCRQAVTKGAVSFRELRYAVLMLAASTFPTFMRSQLSEIYLLVPLMAFVVLVGIAAQGFLGPRSRTAGMALTAYAAICAWGLWSAHEKQQLMAARGRRAQVLVASLTQVVPPTVQDTTVAIIFPAEEKRYSTFVAGDDYLIQPFGPHLFASAWLFPDRGIRLERFIGTGREAPTDLRYCWDAAVARFRAAPSGCSL